MHKIIVITILLITLCIECGAIIRQPVSSYTSENLLWWLPENTETIIVAKGPIVISDSEKGERIDLNNAYEKISYGLLATVQHGQLLKPILGQTILLSVQGSRKFHPPSNLGSMLFEGCDVLVLDQDFVTTRVSFLNLVESQTKVVQRIAGIKVMVYEEKLENDLWKFFIVSPKPNVVLCATDLGYLTEVLTRMEMKGHKRALPEGLPEWKQVDTTAQFWAVRHYDKENAVKDTTSPLHGKQAAANMPDEQAIGITFTYNKNAKNKATIRYLSTNENAAGIANRSWSHPAYQLNPKISKIKPDVVEIITNPNNSDVFSFFLLCLLAAFGHALYI